VQSARNKSVQYYNEAWDYSKIKYEQGKEIVVPKLEQAKVTYAPQLEQG